MFDMIVIGGGPAGSAAAITAARGGARVLLLERGRLPRHKVCGEFVSAESLELLGSLLHGQHLAVLNDAARISRTRLYVDGRMIGAVVDPPAASIARFDLDAALWESAYLAGVDARQQVTVREIGGRGPFRICSSDGEFESRAVINASGRWSNLNGTAAAEQKWVGLKAHFAEPSPEPSVDLYFGRNSDPIVSSPPSARHFGAQSGEELPDTTKAVALSHETRDQFQVEDHLHRVEPRPLRLFRLHRVSLRRAWLDYPPPCARLPTSMPIAPWASQAP